MPHAPEVYPDATPIGNNPYLLNDPEFLDGAPPAEYVSFYFEGLAEDQPESKLKLQKVSQRNQELRINALYGDQKPGADLVYDIREWYETLGPTNLMQAEGGENYDPVAQTDMERAAGGVLISNLVKGAELQVESENGLSVTERLIKRIELNYDKLKRNEATVLLGNLVHTRSLHEKDPELRSELEDTAIALYERAIGDKRTLEYRHEFERQALEYASDLRIRRAIKEYNHADTDEDRERARQKIFKVQENQAAELSMRFRNINRPNERAEWLGRMRIRDYLLASSDNRFSRIGVERALPYERNPIIKTNASHNEKREDGLEVRVQDHGFDANTVIINMSSGGRDGDIIYAYATDRIPGLEVQYPPWVRPIIHESDEDRQKEVADMLYTLYSASGEMHAKLKEGHTLDEMVKEVRAETEMALVRPNR